VSGTPAPTIAFQVFLITLFLTIAWGFVFFGAVIDYRHARRAATERRRQEIVRAFRWVVVTLCLWSLPASFFFRTGLIMAGFGGDAAGQIIFFALVSTNVIGSLFCIVSLRFD
jgi:hypothetical protein